MQDRFFDPFWQSPTPAFHLREAASVDKSCQHRSKTDDFSRFENGLKYDYVAVKGDNIFTGRANPPGEPFFIRRLGRDASPYHFGNPMRKPCRANQIRISFKKISELYPFSNRPFQVELERRLPVGQRMYDFTVLYHEIPSITGGRGPSTPLRTQDRPTRPPSSFSERRIPTNPPDRPQAHPFSAQAEKESRF